MKLAKMFTRTRTPEPLDYEEASRKVAAKEFPSIAAAQHAHKIEQMAQDIPAPDLEKKRAEAQALLDAVEAEERERAALVNNWDAMLEAHQQDLNKLRFAVSQFEHITKDEPASKLAFIHGQCWGEQFGPTGQPSYIVEHYKAVVAMERLIADFPIWRAEMEKRVAKSAKAIDAFAKEHGIQTAPAALN